jgi:hypothetical protein
MFSITQIKNWIQVLCLLLLIEYFLVAKVSIGYLITFFNCINSKFTIYQVLMFSGLIIFPALIILLLKKSKIGWMLTIGSTILLTLLVIYEAYYQFTHQSFTKGNFFKHLELIMIYGVRLVLLSRHDFRDYFEINHQTQKRTIIFSIIICFFILGLVIGSN